MKFVWVVLIFTFLWAPRIQAIEINPEIESLEKSFEVKIVDRIKAFYGEESKFRVNVHLKASPFKEKVAPTPQSLDVGYVPFPISSFQMKPETKPEKKLDIQGAQVELWVASDLEEPTIQEMEKLIVKTLGQIPTTVTISKVAGDNKKKKDELNPPASEKPWRDFLPMITGILGALIMTIGIFLLSSGIRSASTILSDGLRAAFASLKPPKEETIQTELAAEDEKEDADMAPPLNIESATSECSRNLNLIKEAIQTSPMQLIQAIEDKKEEWAGLRWLLPNLTGAEQDRLKQFLGESRLQKLAEIEEVNQNPVLWLQELVEKVMVKRLQGGSVLHRSMDTDSLITLMLASPKQLTAAAAHVNVKASWRILTEFLTKESLESFLSTVSEAQLELLLAAGDISEEEVKSASRQMLQFIEINSEAKMQQAEDRRKYYASVLLNPTVEAILNKELGQDDEFVRDLEAHSPEFAELVLTKVWTPFQLNRVPDGFLAEAIKNLSHDQKTKLIISLPQIHSERIKSLLPEGNVKTIVLDQAEKALRKADAREIKNASAISRQFLDFLRRQGLDGKYEFVKSSVSSISTVGEETDEIEKVA